MSEFDYKDLLKYHPKRNMTFSEFVDGFLEDPESYLKTSSMLVTEAIRHFGFKIVVRSGEPMFSYKIFEDIFSNGINAVYGQESGINKFVSVIESISKETGPNRGLILLGPPASGKTNIIDLLTLALEQYTKAQAVKLYSFYYRFADVHDPSRRIAIRSSFMHNPILFFTTILRKDGGINKPRKELFEYLNRSRTSKDRIFIPSYYQNASLDKRSLDILESILRNPRNQDKTLFEVLEEYVRVEEIEFSNAQALGISNIDDMSKLRTVIRPVETRSDAIEILNQHLPTKFVEQYEGAMVSANRGVLHIHDAFGSDTGEKDYKPLLMLLGSGKISLESSQTSVDTVVVATTNLEEMEALNKQLTSSKLMDRIEKIPINYLLDATSEMDILKRDMSMIQNKYAVDPNLFRIAAFFSVMTRLLPPNNRQLPSHWSQEKKDLYQRITPEQKLFIYASKANDPIAVIQNLPFWHPFRNEAAKMELDLADSETLKQHIATSEYNLSLESSRLFSRDQLRLIDNEFMRELWNEHSHHEGKYGISIRQLQNIMRRTIAKSNGHTILVTAFLEQVTNLMQEGSTLHHWLSMEPKYKKDRPPIPPRKIGTTALLQGQGDYGDFKGMIEVVRAIYYNIIRQEIISATVNRDPVQIEMDLRKYVQYTLLVQATQNKAFAHIMIPQFAFVDPITGTKVDAPDYLYMQTLEKIIMSDTEAGLYRREVAQRFFDARDNRRLQVEEGKSLVASKNDEFINCYEREYNKLLSHRKVDIEIDADKLVEVLFLKQKDPEAYTKTDTSVRDFAESIIENMRDRFGYPSAIGEETIRFALRTGLIDFKKILN